MKNDKHLGTVLSVGAGIAAASLAAYLLWGPGGKKRRQTVKGWMVKMKGEVMEKLETLEEVTEPVYQKIVDQVSAQYGKLKNIDQTELAAVVTDLRNHWQALTKKAKTKTKSRAKKVVKKLV